MSELKARTARSIADEEEMLELGADCTIESAQVYLKEDVDKLIADLEESHKKEVEQLLIEIMKLKHSLELASNECCRISERGVKNARHHKYKRCLAMARLCSSYRFAWSFIPEDDEVHKSDFYKKWEKRWLELAEKFKEGV